MCVCVCGVIVEGTSSNNRRDYDVAYYLDRRDKSKRVFSNKMACAGGCDRLSRVIAVLGPSAAGGNRPEIGYAASDCSRNYGRMCSPETDTVISPTVRSAKQDLYTNYNNRCHISSLRINNVDERV